MSFIIFSILSAIFSGLTTLFAKIGVSSANSTLVTGIRTIVISIFSILVYLLSDITINNLDLKIIFYLLLSAIATTILWLSYFKALFLADVNQVTPIDKLSIVLTLILSFIFLKEKINIAKIISIALMIIGTFLMVKKQTNKNNNTWLLYASLTAIFTSIATILGKIGVININPTLAFMIRSIFILLIIWIIIFIKKIWKDIHKLTKKSIIFIILSGLSTAISWLFYFKALKIGEASIVFQIEKLSAIVSIILSIIFLKEKLDKKGIMGFILIIIASFILILFN